MDPITSWRWIRGPPAPGPSFSTGRAASRPCAQHAFPQILSPGRLGGARPHGDLGHGASGRGGGHRRALPEGSIAGIGVTNQRETTILWDKATGQPVYNAIVWQCRRTAELCEDLKRQGLDERIQSATGLLIDAYFSGSKIRWILDNVPGVRQRAERGELLFGTVETWLIWKLTAAGTLQITPTPPAPCSLTSTRLCWDEELCGILGVPMAMLPQPVPNCDDLRHGAPRDPGVGEAGGSAGLRRRRRPAGRSVRPGLLRTPARPRIPTAPAASP